MGDYGQANLTTYRLPKPYAFPIYNAAQSQQCNIYVPPYSTLSRSGASQQILECSKGYPAVMAWHASSREGRLAALRQHTLFPGCSEELPKANRGKLSDTVVSASPVRARFPADASQLAAAHMLVVLMPRLSAGSCGCCSILLGPGSMSYPPISRPTTAQTTPLSPRRPSSCATGPTCGLQSVIYRASTPP